MSLEKLFIFLIKRTQCIHLLPIGKFLGENPLTAIEDPSPFAEADGVDIVCELDASPK